MGVVVHEWGDIQWTTAYKQSNPFLAPNTRCYSTGRATSGYKVDDMLKAMGAKRQYEVHNALCDAMDELFVMSKFRLSAAELMANKKNTLRIS